VSANIIITLEIATRKQQFPKKNGFYGKFGFWNLKFEISICIFDVINNNYERY
jgi:hypothetical protein